MSYDKIGLLEVPVFTNLGFVKEDLHHFTQRLKDLVPKELHPSGRDAVLHYIDEMHVAFDEYDMRRFGRLYSIVNDKVCLEIRFLGQNGDPDASAIAQEWLFGLVDLEQEMRAVA